MAASNNSLEHLTSIYKNVMDDVIRNVREEFLNEGVDLDILEDLREIWLNKLNKSGAVGRPPKADPPPRPTSSESKASQRQMAQKPVEKSSPLLPPPLVPVQPTSAVHDSPLPPSLIQVQGHGELSGASDRDTITVIHHAPPLTQHISHTDNLAKSVSPPVLSSQQSSIMLPQAISSTSESTIPTPGSRSFPSLLQPSQLATFQQGMVPIQTPRGTMWVPLATFVALQMSQQQQQAQASSNASDTPTNEVQQIDGLSPLLTTHHLALPAKKDFKNGSFELPTHPIATKSLAVNNYSKTGSGCCQGPCAPGASSSEEAASSTHLRKCFEKVKRESRVSLHPKVRSPRKTFSRMPRKGDKVEFIVDGTSRQTFAEIIEQLDGSVRGSSKGHRSKFIPQLDGDGNDSSSDDDSDLDDDSSEDDIGVPSDPGDDEPLNSDDDVADDAEEHKDFDTNDTIVCLWEKVYRVRTKWKFLLKDGIMHLGGFDYVFQKGTGEADW